MKTSLNGLHACLTLLLWNTALAQSSVLPKVEFHIDPQAVRELTSPTLHKDGRLTQAPGIRHAQSMVAGSTATVGNDSGADDEEQNLQEVIVTAEKRPQLEQDVPSSVQVLTAQLLEREGIFQFSDYEQQVPALTLNGSTTGNSGPGQGSPIIRGVSSGPADNSATVAMYLDDVPFTSDSNFKSYDNRVILDPDLFDVDRIEVLEGPQSTLYGANALGGVIRIITKQPNPDMFEGGVQVDGSQVDNGGSGYGVHGYVNMPVVSHSIALRLTVADREDPGYIDNLATNRTNINKDTVKTVRPSLRIKLSDHLETTISAYWQDINQPAPDQIFLDKSSDQPSLGGLAYASPIFQGDRIITRAISDKIKFAMNFATFTNVASHTGSYYHYYFDASLYAALVHASSGDGAQGEYHVTTERYNDEMRLTSAPGRVEWLLGGFYTHERDALGLDILGTDSTGTALAATSRYYNILGVGLVDEYKEYSLFGDLTYHFTNKLEATIGSRYSYDNQPYYIDESGLFASIPIDQGTHSDSGPSYLVTVSYKPKRNITLYLRAADAYRPGGTQPLTPSAVAANINPNFGPDTLWDYEGGAKETFWNGRGSLTVDGYYMSWRGIQLNTTIGHFTEVTNAASAAIGGAEGSLFLSPVDGLTVRFSGDYNDARLTSSVPAIGAYSGAPLPYSQKFSASGGADYVHQLSGRVSGLAGFTYVHHSSMNTTFQNGRTYPIPSYNELDIRIGLEWSRYRVMFRVANATNEYGLTNVGPSTAANGQFAGSVLAPRTYTASFAARF